MNPYSNDYNTVLDEAQRDQNEQARPELANHIENMEDYDVIILGYPNMEQGFESALCVSCSKKGRKRNSMHKRQ